MSVLAVAHRAGNSIARLREAGALGVDVVECDVHSLRERLEVRHLKTAGPLPFLWDRWELAPGWTPRLGLGEVLEAGGRGPLLMLDLKTRRRAAGRSVADLLESRAAARPVLVCGRFWPSVDHVAARLPYVRPVLSARNVRELTSLRRRLAGNGPAPYGVSLHVSLLDREEVADLRTRVEVVMTWPVNNLDLLDRVVGLGANAIISDEPDVLRRVVGWSGR